MISIRPSTVPDYLLDSEFYRSLNVEDDAELSVPEGCFKPDCSVVDEDSLRSLLSTIRFWGVRSIPEVLYKSALDTENPFFSIVASEFQQELLFLSPLIALRWGAIGRNDLVLFAAETGNEGLLNYLLANDYARSVLAAQAAAGGGHLQCLQMLNVAGCAVDNSICIAAAKKGRLDCLKFAHSKGYPWPATQMAQYAIVSGDLPTLQYVVENGATLQRTLYNKAALLDAVDCVQYLHSKGLVFPADYISHAVGVNAVHCVEFALQHGCTFAGNVITFVKSVECMKVLHNSGFQWTAVSAALAAYNSVDILRFLHEHGCPWEEGLYITVIDTHTLTDDGAPNIDSMVYAHENGCPWDRHVSLHAVKVGNLTAVTYLLTQGCPFDTAHTGMAAMNGNYRKLVYLHNHGVPWNELTTSNAANCNFLKCLKYACENGCPMEEKICKYVAQRNFVEVLKYLCSIGCKPYEAEGFSCDRR